MSDIFICYARTDSAVAHRLAERLRAEGWSVFLDVQTRVGQRYDQVIESELETARAAVVLWSSASRKSNDVRDEAKFGRDRNILFPAWIERVNSPLGFGHIQTADLVGWGGEPDHPGLAQLLESLRLHLGGAPVAKPARRWVSTQALSREPEEGEAHPALAPAAPQRPVFTSVFSPGQTFRDRLKIGGEAPLMAVIPAGRFLMGSPPAEGADAEGPQHEVRIAGPFAMGVYAVTFDEYDRFAAAAHREKPGDQGWGRGKRPVINVSWEDGQAYCAWLTEQTGRPYRLPSEAEWEYACRAGTTTPFHFGARITTDQANFDGNYTYNGSTKGKYRAQTVPVGSFPPNAFGLYDMHGNVWEWCQDHWHAKYDGAPGDGSAWETVGEGPFRVLRGGSWGSGPVGCRAAGRNDDHPDFRSGNVGFRVCCGAPSNSRTRGR